MRLGFTLDACKIDDVPLPYHHHHRVKPLLPPLLHLQLHTIDAHHCSTTTPPLAHYKLPHQQIGDSLDLIVAIEQIGDSLDFIGGFGLENGSALELFSQGREKGEKNAGGEEELGAGLATELTLWPRALAPNSPGPRV